MPQLKLENSSSFGIHLHSKQIYELVAMCPGVLRRWGTTELARSLFKFGTVSYSPSTFLFCHRL